MDFKALIKKIESVDGPIITPKAPTLPEAPQLNEDAELRVLAGTSTILAESAIMEKKLTSGEKKKKEEVVKSMKKDKGDFEKRYGKRGEEVMHATATKIAKQKAESIEADKSIEEDMKVGDSKKTSTGGTLTKTATGVKHKAKTWDGEDHAEPAQKKASKAGMTGAERREQKSADKEEEKKSKEWEKKHGKGSVTRHKMEDIDSNAFEEKFSKMVEAAKPDYLDFDKDGDKKEPMKKALKDKKEKKVGESTGDYSAKKARAGKDIGKPGKNFEKIAKKAGKEYGSKERGEKVAGAVLKKLRAKEGVETNKNMVAESIEQSKLTFKEMMLLVVESGGQQQIDPVDRELFDWATRVAKNKLGEGMKAEVYAGMVYERMGGRFEMYDVLSEEKK